MSTTTPLHRGFVGKEKVNERIIRYQQGDGITNKGKYQLLSAAMEQQGFFQGETKYVWYPKQYIEELLTEINLYSGDGIRIYLGEYENEPGVPVGQLCLLMVVTREDGADSGIHHDVILEEEEGFKERISISRMREFNIGAPCPPICSVDGARFPEI